MPFDLQPILKGEFVRLRPLRGGDCDALYAVAKDPLIWEQHPVKERYQEEPFKVFFGESLKSGGALIALDAQNGQPIGASRFHGYQQGNSEIEIGWTFLASKIFARNELWKKLARFASESDPMRWAGRVFAIGLRPQRLPNRAATETRIVGARCPGCRFDRERAGCQRIPPS